MLEWGEPGDVLVSYLVAFDAKLGDGGVDVEGGPENDGVENQAEPAELVDWHANLDLAAVGTMAVGTQTKSVATGRCLGSHYSGGDPRL